MNTLNSRFIILFIYACVAYMLAPNYISAQNVIRDIKSFGARGDGKTNDHDAFIKAAAFFNARGGNGKLIISKGVYIIGKQIKTNGINGRFFLEGQDALHLSGVRNLSIEGSKGSVIQYTPSLKFGAFDPETGKVRKASGYFVNTLYAATLGHCIFIDQSSNVSVKNIECNGNLQQMVIGGRYGDVGIQLPHYGIFIQNSKAVTIEGVNIHHFALDGICVANKRSPGNDRIHMTDSRFEYNGRQGFSWIGGNDLNARNCSFSHNGKTVLSSPPGAGLDIEAEYGPNSGGLFENCEFTDNQGVCMLADSGDSENCLFKNCLFWSSTTWSIWVTKPAFKFIDCIIYGPIVHGYDSPNDKDATQFSHCLFEDKPYKGQQPSGEFLLETNNKRRVRFDNCSFVANHKKLFWISAPASWKPEEKYQLNNNTFVMNNTSFPATAYVGVLRGATFKGNTFKFAKGAKEKGYHINDCCEQFNVDGGANKTQYLK